MCLKMHVVKEEPTTSQIACAKCATGVRVLNSDKMMCWDNFFAKKGTRRKHSKKDCSLCTRY